MFPLGQPEAANRAYRDGMAKTAEMVGDRDIGITRLEAGTYVVAEYRRQGFDFEMTAVGRHRATPGKEGLQ
jgi:hypothetical protein